MCVLAATAGIGSVEWKLANQENNTEEKLFHPFARFNGRGTCKKTD
jgi:hypothetical protein